MDNNKLLRRFGCRLRELRDDKNYTQEELASIAGFSRSYYSDIETGKRNISLINIYKLSEALGVSLKDLFDF